MTSKQTGIVIVMVIVIADYSMKEIITLVGNHLEFRLQHLLLTINGVPDMIVFENVIRKEDARTDARYETATRNDD